MYLNGRFSTSRRLIETLRRTDAPRIRRLSRLREGRRRRERCSVLLAERVRRRSISMVSLQKHVGHPRGEGHSQGDSSPGGRATTALGADIGLERTFLCSRTLLVIPPPNEADKELVHTCKKSEVACINRRGPTTLCTGHFGESRVKFCFRRCSGPTKEHNCKVSIETCSSSSLFFDCCCHSLQYIQVFEMCHAFGEIETTCSGLRGQPHLRSVGDIQVCPRRQSRLWPLRVFDGRRRKLEQAGNLSYKDGQKPLFQSNQPL